MRSKLNLDRLLFPLLLTTILAAGFELRSDLSSEEKTLANQLIDKGRDLGRHFNELSSRAGGTQQAPKDLSFKLGEFFIRRDSGPEISMSQIEGRSLQGVSLNNFDPDLVLMNSKVEAVIPNIRVRGKLTGNGISYGIFPTERSGTFTAVRRELRVHIDKDRMYVAPWWQGKEPQYQDGYRTRERVNIEDIRANGLCGLKPEGDQLVAYNPGFEYVPGRMYVTVKYPKEGQLVKREIENKMKARIWRYMTYYLDKQILDRVNRMLRQRNVGGMFGRSANEEKQFRSYSDDVLGNANNYTDGFLSILRNVIQQNGLDPIPIPEVKQKFEKQGFLKTWEGTFRASNGKMWGLSTIHRTGDATLDYNSSTLYVSAALGLNNVRVRYNDYEAEFMGFGPKGSLDAKVSTISVYMKTHVNIFQLQAVLDKFEIRNVGDVDVDLTGFSILNWFISAAANWFIGSFKDYIIDRVEEEIEKQVNETMVNFSPMDYINLKSTFYNMGS